MSKEEVMCPGCGKYVPGDQQPSGRTGPSKCKARNKKNLPRAWAEGKPHVCPGNAYVPAEQ